MATSTSLARSSTSQAHTDASSPTNVLLNTPPPVLHLLGYAAPFIRTLTPVAQALTWNSSNPWHSWLLLASWWCICLFGDALLKYGFNAIFLLAIGLGALSTRKTGQENIKELKKDELDTSMSPERLQSLLEETRHFNAALQNLIFTYHVPLRNLIMWKKPTQTRIAVSYLVTSYPCYLAFTYFIGTRYAFLVLGSVALCWHAKWFQVLFKALKKSLVLRIVARTMRALALQGGMGAWLQLKRGRKAGGIFSSYKSNAVTNIDKSSDSLVLAAESEGEEDAPDMDVIFTFNVYENQRWWMGLDWTQALLPNERSPWTDYSLSPVAPPSAFALPSPVTTLVPAPTPSNPLSQIKRTTTWEWVDPDWHVRPDSHSLVPIKASSASTSLQSSANTATPSNPAAFADWARNKALIASQNVRKNSIDAGSPKPTATSTASKRNSSLFASSSVEEEDHSNVNTHDALSSLPKGAALKEEKEVEWNVDDQGWMYGDNSWEKMNAKSGLGRYTRRRVWVRRARVVESVERVADDTGLRQRKAIQSDE